MSPAPMVLLGKLVILDSRTGTPLSTADSNGNLKRRETEARELSAPDRV
jgi:hypothetical protein